MATISFQRTTSKKESVEVELNTYWKSKAGGVKYWVTPSKKVITVYSEGVVGFTGCNIEFSSFAYADNDIIPCSAAEFDKTLKEVKRIMLTLTANL